MSVWRGGTQKCLVQGLECNKLCSDDKLVGCSWLKVCRRP